MYTSAKPSTPKATGPSPNACGENPAKPETHGEFQQGKPYRLLQFLGCQPRDCYAHRVISIIGIAIWPNSSSVFVRNNGVCHPRQRNNAPKQRGPNHGFAQNLAESSATCDQIDTVGEREQGGHCQKNHRIAQSGLTKCKYAQWQPQVAGIAKNERRQIGASAPYLSRRTKTQNTTASATWAAMAASVNRVRLPTRNIGLHQSDKDKTGHR